MFWSGAPLAGMMLHCKMERVGGGVAQLHKTQVDETHAGSALSNFVFATAQMQQNRAGRRGLWEGRIDAAKEQPARGRAGRMAGLGGVGKWVFLGGWAVLTATMILLTRCDG